MDANPFAPGYDGPPPGEGASDAPARKPKTDEALITEPGAYADIDGDRYHAVEICSSPSISSTGLKTIENETPFHYWYGSPLNPNRPVREQKSHFNIGKGVHDLLLLHGLFPKNYHILPEGYDGRLKRWAGAKEEREAALESDIPVLTFPQYRMIEAMAEQVQKDELAKALLISGTPEMTVIAKDPATGVFMRARPDVLPETMDILPDIKTTISAHPEAFEKQSTNLGYFQSAAHYIDCVDLVFGEPERKRRFVLIAVEKEPPHLVQIYQLDDEDIQMGRMLNRRALNIFAECLKSGVWPAYSRPENPVLHLHMSRWKHAQINQRVDSGELSWEG
jgi:hypothetical protein